MIDRPNALLRVREAMQVEGVIQNILSLYFSELMRLQQLVNQFSCLDLASGVLYCLVLYYSCSVVL